MKQLALVLAFCLVACGRPAIVSLAPNVADDSTGLPPIPTQVISQLGPIPVVWADSLVDDKGRALMGGFHTLRRIIYVNSAAKKYRAVAWQIVLHEQCHVWLHDTGLRSVIADDVQQQICDASATYKVAEMILAGRR